MAGSSKPPGDQSDSPPSHSVSPAGSQHALWSGAYSRATTVLNKVGHHFARHVGAGIMASVAYFDPGNWSVDLQAGANYGFKLLFVIFLSGLGAIVLQVLACKLGCVTGLDLASHCRVLLYNHPKYPRLVRRLVLYPLYVMSEIAIISTDLAELLGSAIALTLIFPRLPLWAGVILTSLDVLVLLAINDNGKGRPVRAFETIIMLMVLAVLICFTILIYEVDPNWPAAFKGFLPSRTLVNPGALYIAIGIIGATVMPHALYLGSSLATLDRISRAEPTLPHPSTSRASALNSIIGYLKPGFHFRRTSEQPGGPDRRTRYEFRQNNRLFFVRSHLGHGVVDIALSLLFVAMPINSAILIFASAFYFFDSSSASSPKHVGLFDVHHLIEVKLGKAAAFVFALALLCAGQSASLTATFSGQIVSEGFLEWKVSPLMRRLITRLMSLIPSTIVAATVGRAGIDSLLVVSQVILSFVLPFAVFPLVYLTSSRVVMRVTVPSDGVAPTTDADNSGTYNNTEGVKEIDYSNSRFLMILGYLIFCFVVVTNAYVLVTLMLGKGGD